MEQFRQVIKDMKESVITKASSEELINTCMVGQMFYLHLQTMTGQPTVAGAAGI